MYLPELASATQLEGINDSLPSCGGDQALDAFSPVVWR